MRPSLPVFAALTLLLTVSSARAQDARLQVIFSGADNPTPLDEYGVARFGHYAALSRTGRITASVDLSEGPSDTSALVVGIPDPTTGAFTFSLIARDGQVIDADLGLTLDRIYTDFRDVGFAGDWALFQSILQDGRRALYGGAGTMELLSVGGEPCQGLRPGIFQQGGNGDVRVNREGDFAFADCSGFNVNGTNVSFTDPPQGASGGFMGGSGPFIRALDDDGGLWVAASTTCSACEGGAMHGLWRIDEGGPVLAFDSSAHPEIAPIVRTSFPSLNGNGDFAAIALVGSAGEILSRSAVIAVMDGETSVVAQIGDEAIDRPGRPITSVLVHPNGATGAYLDDEGDVVFLAHVDNPPGQALLRASGGTIETVVMTGDVVDDPSPGSTVVGLSPMQMAVGRTGHLAIAGAVQPPGSLTTPAVLFLDAEGGGVRCGLVEGQLIERVVGLDAEPVMSFIGPLVPARNDPLFIGNGTSADGFSDVISDDGRLLATVRTPSGEALVLVGGEAPVAPPGLDLTVSGPTEPIEEQTSFVVRATVTPDGVGSLGAGLVELTLVTGDLRIAELPPGCESDEDGIGNFSSITCPRDFDTMSQTDASFFVIGPEAIEIAVHATSTYGEDFATFEATTAAAGADLAATRFEPGSSIVLIENHGPVTATGVVVELSDYTGGGKAAERVVVGSIAPGESALVDTLEIDDAGPFEITARVESEIVDNDLTNNTVVLVRDEDNSAGCGCTAPARRAPGAGLVVVCVGLLVARRRRRG